MKQCYIIRHGYIYTPHKVLREGYVWVEDGKITKISDRALKSADSTEVVIDATDKMVVPGFIDLQPNGGGGSFVVDGTPEAIANIIQTHAKFGTTGMLPTVES